MDKNNTTEDIKNQGIKKNFQRSRNNSDQTSDASGDGSQGEGSSLPTSESEDQPGTRRKRSRNNSDQTSDASGDGSQGESSSLPTSESEDQPGTRRTRSRNNSDQTADASGDGSQGERSSLPTSESEDQPGTRRTRSRNNSDQTSDASGDGSQGERSSLPTSESEDQPVTRRTRSRTNSDQTSDASGDGSQGEGSSLPTSESEDQPGTRRTRSRNNSDQTSDASGDGSQGESSSLPTSEYEDQPGTRRTRSRNNSDQTSDASGDGSQGEGSSLPTSESEDQPVTRQTRSRNNSDQTSDASGDGSQGESSSLPTSESEDQPGTRRTRSRNNSDQTSDASGDGSQGEGSSLPTSESEDQPGTRRKRSRKNSDQTPDASCDGSQGESSSLPTSQSEDQPVTRRTRSRKNSDRTADASGDGSQGENSSLPTSQSEDQPVTKRVKVKLERSPEVPVSRPLQPGTGKETRETHLTDDGRFKQDVLQNTFYLRPTEGSGDFEHTSYVRHLKEVPYKIIVTNDPSHSFPKVKGGFPAKDSIGPEKAQKTEAGTEHAASRNVPRSRKNSDQTADASGDGSQGENSSLPTSQSEDQPVTKRVKVKLERSPEVPVSRPLQPGTGKETRETHLTDDGRFKQDVLQNTFYLRPTEGSGDFEHTSYVRHLKEVPYNIIVTNDPSHSFPKVKGGFPAKDSIGPEKAQKTEAGTEHAASRNVLRSRKNSDQTADASGDGSQVENSSLPTSQSEDQPVTKRVKVKLERSPEVPVSRALQPGTGKETRETHLTDDGRFKQDVLQNTFYLRPTEGSGDFEHTSYVRHLKEVPYKIIVTNDSSHSFPKVKGGFPAKDSIGPEKAQKTEAGTEHAASRNVPRPRKNSDQTSDASGDGSQGEGSSLPTSESEDQPVTRRTRSRKNSDQTPDASGDESQGESSSLPTSQSEAQPVTRRTRSRKHSDQTADASGDGSQGENSSLPTSQSEDQPVTKRVKVETSPEVPVSRPPQPGTGKETRETQQEERRFQFQIQNKGKLITVNGVYDTPVISVIKRSLYFQNALKKSKKKGLLLHASTKLEAMVNPNMPCGLIPQDELVTITFIKGEERKEDAVSRSDVKLFCVEPKGETENGGHRIILECECLRTKNVRLAVCGHPHQDLRNALTDDGRFKKDVLQNTFYLRPTKGSGEFEPTSHVRHLKKVPYKLIVTNDPSDSFSKVKGEFPAKDSIGPEKAQKTEAGTEHAASRNVPMLRTDRTVPYFEKALLEWYPRWINEGQWLEKALKADSKATDKSSHYFKVFREQFGKEINNSTPIAVHEMLAELGRSVGYVTWPGIPSKHPSATCFVLKDEYIITNHHVIQQIVGVGNTQEGMWSQMIRERASIHFVHTHDVPHDKDHGWFSVKSLTKCHDSSLDYAILQLEKKEKIPPGLATKIPKNIPNDLIYIIGHPDGGTKATDTCKIITYPDDVFKMRLQEGAKLLCHPANCVGVFPQGDYDCLHLMNRRYCETAGKDFPELLQEDKLAYDTSFFWGSSGSPVFTSMGGLIALHTCGYIGKFQWKPKHILEFGTCMTAIRSHVEETDKELYEKLFHQESNVPMEFD
ncbi:serine-rich adhesin for platelets-like isoform X2 [Pleurodeles waltl]|uniref:serine-rich adhesin for platelets-like isoform X2 n=1 Tax=Pleurodeles waltl TaxID=8319 RepID=UPI0037099EA6